MNGADGSETDGDEEDTEVDTNPRGVALATLVQKYKNHRIVERSIHNQRQHGGTGHRDQDSMVTAFLGEAGSFALLTKPDEAELFTIINQGLELYQSLPNLDNLTPAQEELLIRTAAARQVVFVTNQRLVFDIAKKYAFNDSPWLMDLTQQGMIGLAKAIARFDTTRELAFSTYATWWIRQEITRYIGNASRTIRLPVHRHEQYIKMSGIVRGLSVNLGRDPEREEIEKATGLPYTDYEELMLQGRNHLPSLDTSTKEDVDIELGDYVADPNANPDIHIEHVSNMEELKGILLASNLSSREKFVVGLRFGLTGDYFDKLEIDVRGRTVSYSAANALLGGAGQYTLEYIATLFGVTRERIRQIESDGIKGLRVANKRVKQKFAS